MQREIIEPRKNWQDIVEGMRLDYHTAGGKGYWNKSVCYRLSANEVNRIEQATNELAAQSLELVQHVIDKNLFAQLGILEMAIDHIKDSWNRDEMELYGRFDLSIDRTGEIKMLEYNADTPTSLLETAVIQ